MFKQKGSIKTKLMLGTIIPIALLSLLFSLGFYFQATAIVKTSVIPQFERLLGSNLMDLADKIDADLINDAKINKQAHDKLLAEIDKSREKSGFENVYIMSKVDGEDVIRCHINLPNGIF